MKTKSIAIMMFFLLVLAMPAANETKKIGLGVDLLGSISIPTGLLYQGWGLGTGGGARVHFNLMHNIRGFLGGSYTSFAPVQRGTNTSITLIVVGARLANDNKPFGVYIVGGIGLGIVPECHYSDSMGLQTIYYKKTTGMGFQAGGGYAYSLTKSMKIFGEWVFCGIRPFGESNVYTSFANFACFTLNIGMSILLI